MEKLRREKIFALLTATVGEEKKMVKYHKIAGDITIDELERAGYTAELRRILILRMLNTDLRNRLAVKLQRKPFKLSVDLAKLEEIS